MEFSKTNYNKKYLKFLTITIGLTKKNPFYFLKSFLF
jgi:hypothetical protein